MLTKNKIQFIKNLHEKSGRYEAGLFLVEWRKGIMEFIESDFEIVEGYFTDKFVVPIEVGFHYEIVSQKDLERISALSSNEVWLIVVKMRQYREDKKSDGLTLILDGINDPGNLGTIIRIADWYGVSRIIASIDTVDCYNPKVIMATMGSFTRVRLEYRDLQEYLSQLKSKKIYWAYLDGENIRTKKFTPVWWYLVIGSESHGIRSNLEQYITDKITIPRAGLAESLNAGVATAVILERMVG
jgi:RNA methyltransferase, TrmH family